MTNSSGTVKCTDAISGNGTSSEICADTTNGSIVNGTSTYTHPAFTFGDTELTGFWVGKFEVSATSNKITIKPNVNSLRSQSVASFFNAIQHMNTTYSLNGDSHMMKNMEWGAVAYLSHSKYGTCVDGDCVEVTINSNSSYYTGGGISNAYKTNITQSTTQNIYGIYDMSGGAWEYVMGNMVNSSGTFYSSGGGFATINVPDSKYFDSYTYSTSYITHGRGKLGDATKETLKKFGSNTGGGIVITPTFWIRQILGSYVGAATVMAPELVFSILLVALVEYTQTVPPVPWFVHSNLEAIAL